MNNLIDVYNARVLREEIHGSLKQMEILESFDQLTQALKKPEKTTIFRKKKQISGIYLYGAVGSGKTFLMDLFFECLPVANKIRVHFYHWMQQIDASLRQLQGVENPLRMIADKFAKSARVICVDEFMVQDPVQAMILAELLPLLFARGVALVATSNIRPDDLYQNGFQRERFLKAIDLIKSHCKVLVLESGRDYRLDNNIPVATCLFPANDVNQAKLRSQFQILAPEAMQNGVLTIQKRLIPFIQCHDRVVWFDFKALCHIPRSQLDYLEIAERFDTIFLSDVPVFSPQDIVPAILFMHLVDVLYDSGIRLVMSAEAPVDALMVSCAQEIACERTISRLMEMQTTAYRVR